MIEPFDDPVGRLEADPEMRERFASVAAEFCEEREYVYVQFPTEYANELLDAWNHIMDHQCEGAYEVFATFNTAVIDIILQLMGGAE